MLFRRASHDPRTAVDLAFARAAAQGGETAALARAAEAELRRLRAAPAADAAALTEWIEKTSRVARYDLALPFCRHRLAREPESAEAQFDLALCCFEMAEFEEAERLFDALRAGPQADIAFYRGALAERREDWETAAHWLGQAHQLRPSAYAPLLAIDPERIQRTIEDVYDALPRDTFDALSDVPLLADPLPSDALLHLAQPPFSPLILGLHHGRDLRRRSVFHTTPVIDGIRVFPRNIAKVAWSLEQFDEQLERTLLHEIGHRLGWEEEDLWSRGL